MAPEGQELLGGGVERHLRLCEHGHRLEDGLDGPFEAC